MGPAGPGRARPVRAADARGLPVGPVLADDPAQARGLPEGFSRLRPGAGRPVPRARRRAAARGRLDRPSPRQDRGGDRECTGDARAPRSRHPVAGALLGGRTAPAQGAAVARRVGRLDARVGGACAAAPGCGLPLRRPDDGAGGAAGVRRRQRPPRHLLGPRGGRAGAGLRPGRSAKVRTTAERRWSGVGDFEYGQWRYRLVEACPRDLTGNRLASVGDSRYAPPD